MCTFSQICGLVWPSIPVSGPGGRVLDLGLSPPTVPLGPHLLISPLGHSSLWKVVNIGVCRQRGFYLTGTIGSALGGQVPPDAQGDSLEDWSCLPPGSRRIHHTHMVEGVALLRSVIWGVAAARVGVREGSRGGGRGDVGGGSGGRRATFAHSVGGMKSSFPQRLTPKRESFRRQPSGERHVHSPHAVAHIVDLLFSQSARCAVRKEEGCEKSLCLAMFGRWDSGTAPFCNGFRCVSEVGKRKEGRAGAGRREDRGGRREKGGRRRKETGKGRPYTDTNIGSCPPKGNSR